MYVWIYIKMIINYHVLYVYIYKTKYKYICIYIYVYNIYIYLKTKYEYICIYIYPPKIERLIQTIWLWFRTEAIIPCASKIHPLWDTPISWYDMMPQLPESLGYFLYFFCEHHSWSVYIGFSPKSSIVVGFSLINHPFLGTPIYGPPPRTVKVLFYHKRCML